MLRCHESQDIWLQHMFDTDIVANMVRVASFRGIGPGVKYAEGFRSLNLFPIPGRPHLLP